jgi:hypothetical protein
LGGIGPRDRRLNGSGLLGTPRAPPAFAGATVLDDKQGLPLTGEPLEHIYL